MRVLVVGYGKIGKIKSSLWKSLGARVFAYDRKGSAAKAITQDGFIRFNDSFNDDPEDFIIDISTSASQHFAALQWAVSSIHQKPAAILIEKPIVSSREERADLIHFVQNFEPYDLHDIIYVNESYHSSLALKQVKTALALHGEPIRSVRMELSKNRLHDNQDNRFFDHNLGSIGIELPHMIAALQALGLSLEALRDQTPRLLVHGGRLDNQGLILEYNDGPAAVSLATYLGDFRLGENGLLDHNRETIRSLQVSTAEHNYHITFDPTPGLPRYFSEVTEQRTDGSPPRTISLADNHLNAHLAMFLSRSLPPDMRELLSLQNALSISDLLCSLKENSVTHAVNFAKPRRVAPKTLVD